ncbi:hypothetical protein [Pseudaestuariivita atlantica]|uniref:Uncharacterized protein n=1 Tax=Pseudaestuariivita atlantica TaxID=1317121 RepID=A0A0L1JUK9_9RHOB|nr:hypothetical protein [Pseudaestuariivita atlantica]KNG95436.1 hypothetical protein ATO11_02200 [Pseudaestuariivita atlantica]
MGLSDMIEDPKGLIREAYRIEGIGADQCRSIFLDWALSLPDTVPQKPAIEALLKTYGAAGHPMTEVLEAGLQTISAPRRRGGWRSRARQ